MKDGGDHLTRPASLLWTRQEHDACALIANIRKGGHASHGNVKRTLEALTRMGHRTGEVNGEGDGCGLLTDIPRRLWGAYLEQEGYPGALAQASRFFVGHIFIPAAQREHAAHIQQRISDVLTAHGCNVFVARVGPVRSSALGPLGRRDEPIFWQTAGILRSGEPESVDSHLFTVQLALERELPVHVISLSSHTVVYKVRGSVDVLGHYYPELRNPEFESAMTIGHGRYSTNTLSVFERVQPFTLLAHNGEINTIIKLCQEARMLGVELVPGASDSQHVNRVLATLVSRYKLTLLEAMEILFPLVPYEIHNLPPTLQAVYTYLRQAFGPFCQGPAAIFARWGDDCVFSCDALGLRPIWFGETEKEYFFSSEKGVVPLEEMVCDPKPLAPAEKMAVHVQRGRGVDILEYAQIQQHVWGRVQERFGPLLAQTTTARPRIVAPIAERPKSAAQTATLLPALGWGHDDIDYICYLADHGSEPIGSLGYDGPLAALSPDRQNLADYYKESVAVVTNPAIDREREEEHFSTEALIGPRPPLGSDPCTDLPGRLIQLDAPLLLDGSHCTRVSPEKKRAIAERHGTMLWDDLLACWDSTEVVHLAASYSEDETLPAALHRLGAEAVAAVLDGAQVVILDDRTITSPGILWLDPLLAVTAVDRALRYHETGGETNLRRRVGVILRSGALRNLHDLALTLGCGADAVCPYMLWTVGCDWPFDNPPADAPARLEHLLVALKKGLEKVTSTMGIHELRGYSRIFSSIGLSTPVAQFMETINFCGSDKAGLGWEQVDADARARAAILAGGAEASLTRPKHFWTGVWKAAAAVADGSAPYAELAEVLAQRERELPVALRHIMDLVPDPQSAIEPHEVDTRAGIHSYPIVISAMSFGSQGETAFRAYAEAARRMNIICLNGEGGEITDMLGKYTLHRGQQVASGRFGVNAALLNSAYVIEIKIGQGAKPGEGGHLPGKKVSAKVAAARRSTPGIDLISPSNNHDLYSIEDLAQLVEELKTANPHARVAVKVPVVPGIGIIAVGIAKAGADIINLSGYDGGTGAARKHALKFVGLPAEIGVAEAHRALTMAGLRNRCEIWCDGGMKGAADVMKMICLGANRVGFGTMAMVAIGCVICRSCQTDTCRFGIACQLETVEEAQAKGVTHFSPRAFDLSVERLCRFFTAIGEEIRVLTARLGARRTQDLVGRGHLVQRAYHDRLDLTAMLTPLGLDAAPPPPAHRIVRLPRSYLTKAISSLVTEVATQGDRVVSFYEDRLGAADRALGTHLGGALVRWKDEAAQTLRPTGGGAPPSFAPPTGHNGHDLPVESVRLNFNSGSIPGNGLAAFNVDPLHVVVEGGAQDGVGKGASGGTVKVLKGMNHLGVRLDGSVGKSFAYGAQRGLFIVQGNADSRACIRLSGADVVLGGEITQPLDDVRGLIGCRANLKAFAFEYMTAGRVLVLGDPGPYICAGMTGGVVYIRLNPPMGLDIAAIRRRIARGARVEVGRVSQRDEEAISTLLTAYVNALRESDQGAEADRVATYMNDWSTRFVKIVPVGQLLDQEVSTE